MNIGRNTDFLTGPCSAYNQSTSYEGSVMSCLPSSWPTQRRVLPGITSAPRLCSVLWFTCCSKYTPMHVFQLLLLFLGPKSELSAITMCVYVCLFVYVWMCLFVCACLWSQYYRSAVSVLPFFNWFMLLVTCLSLSGQIKEVWSSDRPYFDDVIQLPTYLFWVDLVFIIFTLTELILKVRAFSRQLALDHAFFSSWSRPYVQVHSQLPTCSRPCMYVHAST